MDSTNKKGFVVGQSVWVLTIGEPVHEATISSIFNISVPGSNDEKQLVKVEWTDEKGDEISKTVSIKDIFHRSAEWDKKPNIVTNMSQVAQDIEIPVMEQPSMPSNPVQTTEYAKEQPISERSVCPICKMLFKNKRGVRVHISKKHPNEANELLLSDILKHNSTEKTVSNDVINIQKSKIKEWASTFEDILKSRTALKTDELDAVMKDFLGFLRESNELLPGPKHPAVRFYKLRTKNKMKMRSKGSGEVSNPQRSSKSARDRRAEQYQYELAQYNYYNRRKKVVQTVMNADAPKGCPIGMQIIEDYFRSTFEKVNSAKREVYDKYPTKPNLVSITIQAVHKAIKSTSLDTAPGPDGVLIRTVKALDVAHILKSITEILLKFGYLPKPLREGRTMLIYKGKGVVSSLTSWRPITIYSIIRRIVEKVLDSELRKQIAFHPSQRGFIKGLPGCQVNTRLIDAILNDAKQNKKDGAVAFLDVTGAFDNVGHEHVLKTLEERGVSSDLQNAISALLSNNTIQISVGSKKSHSIDIRRGVPQGGPLSPTLFNLSIDHLYKEVCDNMLASRFGYKLHEGHEPLILTGFADDQAVSARSEVGAVRIIDVVRRLFKGIGLEINATKSSAIVMKDGILRRSKLVLENGDEIVSIGGNETIKYLGCSFSGELTVNENAIQKLNENMSKLSSSNLLKPDQKLNVINQYLFPSLIYPFQSAPLTKLKPSLLDAVDVMIRRNVKAMLGLPANTSTAMLYAPRRYRGLGLLRCQWEAPLQHWSLVQKLVNVKDSHFQQSFDYETEVAVCANRLGLDDINVAEKENQPVRQIRKALREKAFHEWSSCKWQGIGINHFKDNPKANKFLTEKKVLSCSEWVNTLKLNINYAPLRGVPGVSGQSIGDVGSLCRKCGRESETPAHVLGSCPQNMLLITRRHHRVKHAITELLKEKNFDCFEEVFAVDSEGSTRYADIIAFKKNSNEALILDPTVRFESNDEHQAMNIHLEKKVIYDKCIPYYKEKYREQFGEREFKVHGLWFGSRGTIPLMTAKFFANLNVDQNKLMELAENIIVDSLGIIHHHIYG